MFTFTHFCHFDDRKKEKSLKVFEIPHIHSE